MKPVEKPFEDLSSLFAEYDRALRNQKSFERRHQRSPAFIARNGHVVRDPVILCRQAIEGMLEELACFPGHHRSHFDRLEAFWADAPFERSVFVMTKYPDGADQTKDDALVRVIEAVKTAVLQAGYHPNLASDHAHQDLIWENAEVGLLGSARGVAIFERRHRDEVNPNVAMEHGWMLGMGRPVLCLREGNFGDLRANNQGRIVADFEWDDPEEAITAAIRNFLP